MTVKLWLYYPKSQYRSWINLSKYNSYLLRTDICEATSAFFFINSTKFNLFVFFQRCQYLISHCLRQYKVILMRVDVHDFDHYKRVSLYCFWLTCRKLEACESERLSEQTDESVFNTGLSLLKRWWWCKKLSPLQPQVDNSNYIFCSWFTEINLSHISSLGGWNPWVE